MSGIYCSVSENCCAAVHVAYSTPAFKHHVWLICTLTTLAAAGLWLKTNGLWLYMPAAKSFEVTWECCTGASPFVWLFARPVWNSGPSPCFKRLQLSLEDKHLATQVDSPVLVLTLKELQVIEGVTDWLLWSILPPPPLASQGISSPQWCISHGGLHLKFIPLYNQKSDQC